MHAIAALCYFGLAVHAVRSSSQQSDYVFGVLLFLMGTMTAGTALSHAAQDPAFYGAGRILTFFGSGFMPIAFYVVYRQYTAAVPNTLVIALLSIVPAVTTLLALTNSMHNLIWAVVETDSGIYFSSIKNHYWFTRVHAPFGFMVLGYSIVALTGRLHSIARAHRQTVIVLLICAVLPYLVAFANLILGVGPLDFPFTSMTIVLLLPLYWYAAISLRFYEFSPIGYQTLFDHARDPIFVIDADERIICANKNAQKLLGGSEKELIGRLLWEDFPEAREILRLANELDLTQTLRFNKDHVYELSVGPLTGSKGQNLGMVVVCRDVTERRQAQSKLVESEGLVRTLIETSSNGILRFARDRMDGGRRYRCVFANRAAESYLGCDTGTLVGMPLDKLGQLQPDRLITHFNDESGEGSTLAFEVATEVNDGNSWLRVVGEPVGDDFSVTLIDITQRKHNETKMLADALRDPLTSVLNRRGFESEANAAIRNEDSGAVLYLDLNQFKTINDRFGHGAGDSLLKAFGHRLEFCLRPEDVLGRLGGDEFAIVLPGVSIKDAKHVAQRLVQTASEAYIIQGQEIKCTASVGIALIPKHGRELWHLISVADQAMYNAKSQGQDDDAANDCAAYVDAATAT
jgi:diguanylate cyclase (GGDEF)-like protein/PAS domain S-box-containing protein